MALRIRTPARLALLTLFTVAAISAGCDAPTDRWTRVRADAPLLAEGEDDAPVAAVLRPGDLVRVVRTVKPHLAWKGVVDGKPLSVEGELVEVRRSGEGGGLLFRQHLGDEVPAIKADYLCRRLRAGPECAAKLRRVALDTAGSTFAYLPCFADACPMALVRGRRLSQATVDGLTDVRPAVIDGQQAMLVSALVAHQPEWTEGFLHVFRTDDHLEKAFTIQVSEVDTRTKRNHFLEGAITVEPDHISFRGRDRTTSALHDGALLSEHPVAQDYRLTFKR